MAESLVVNRLVAELAAMVQLGKRTLVGIVGAPGSGKSTLAKLLVTHFGDIAVVIPMDGFHLAQVELNRLGIHSKKGSPETFDSAGFANLLLRIKVDHATTIYAPDFHRELEEPVAASIAVDSSVQLVLVEGNYLLLEDSHWLEVGNVLDWSIFLSTDEDVRRSRLIARHIEFGRNEPDARAWVDQVDESNAKLVAATRYRAAQVLSSIDI